MEPSEQQEQEEMADTLSKRDPADSSPGRLRRSVSPGPVPRRCAPSPPALVLRVRPPDSPRVTLPFFHAVSPPQFTETFASSPPRPGSYPPSRLSRAVETLRI
jgi:hypothetical protein